MKKNQIKLYFKFQLMGFLNVLRAELQLFKIKLKNWKRKLWNTTKSKMENFNAMIKNLLKSGDNSKIPKSFFHLF